MRARIFPLSAFVALLASSSALAQANGHCSRFQTFMTPEILYEVLCAESVSTCIRPAALSIVKDKATPFIFKTGATPVANSLVVLQLKYVGTTPRSDPSNVRLMRHRLDFACYRRNRNHVRTAIPDDPDMVDRAPEVSYRGYDEFHRYGFTGGADRDVLANFHTRYFNGETCVPTTDTQRRAQFLFEDRSNVAGAFQSVWRRLGGSDGRAIAAPGSEILKYQQLHVVVSNYRKRPQENGCFGFSVQGAGGAVEIAMSDIEENVRDPRDDRRFFQRKWTLDVRPQ